MRYIILVLLNLPVILLALLNIITQYKLGKTTRRRFMRHIMTWLVLLIVLIGSFPAYNIFIGNALFDASELSLFDVAEITAIIFLFYVVNRQHQQIEKTEKNLRELHQELSIKLSLDNKK